MVKHKLRLKEFYSFSYAIFFSPYFFFPIGFLFLDHFYPRTNISGPDFLGQPPDWEMGSPGSMGPIIAAVSMMPKSYT